MKHIPPIEEVRERLSAINRQGLIKLADEAEVPFHTLRKVATGETVEPGWSLVRKVLMVIGRKRKKEPNSA